MMHRLWRQLSANMLLLAAVSTRLLINNVELSVVKPQSIGYRDDCPLLDRAITHARSVGETSPSRIKGLVTASANILRIGEFSIFSK